MANSETTTEKHLELIGTWVDDLINEQQKFQQYSKSVAKTRQEHIRWLSKRLQDNIEARESGEYELPTRIEESGLKPLPDAPPRSESLLLLGQLDRFCGQLNEHVDNNTHRILLSSQLNSSN